MSTLHGVYPILPTPFKDNGAVDTESLERLIRYMRDQEVHGVAILGYLGEAHKLSTKERVQVMRAVIDAKPPELQVYVGVRALGAAGAVEQGEAAAELGADGLFVAPIAVQNQGAQRDFFGAVAAQIALPILIHDYPESFGVTLSVETIAGLANEHLNITGIKLEERPVLTKLSRLLERLPEFRVFGGLGGLYCLEELERGAAGIMTGFAFPGILVRIYAAIRAGDYDRAAAIYDRYATLIRYEFQPSIGLAFRKHIYKKRGIFESTHVRPPATELDAQSRNELERILERLELNG